MVSEFNLIKYMLSFSALEKPVSRNSKTSENLKLGGANR